MTTSGDTVSESAETGGGEPVDVRREALEERRDHLLASLDDLDAEYAAGDIDEHDYEALRADYTARAAAAIRELAPDSAATTDPSGPPSGRGARGSRRTVAWVLGTMVVAVLAGVLLAQFSGSRTAGDTITGDVRSTTREMLFDAQQAFGRGDFDEAIATYDDVLAQQPSNAEALTYKGWLVNLGGDPETAAGLVEDAVAVDPAFPDARVFAASIALDLGDAERAAAHLDALDDLEAPPFVLQLLAQFRLRERVEAALDPSSDAALARRALEEVGPVLLVEEPPAFSTTGFTVDDVILAAEELAAAGELVDAVKLFDVVLLEFPDDVDALAGRGWLIARSGVDELVDSAAALLDRALELDPAHPEALVYRAFVLDALGDDAAAGADLEAFDALDDPPEDLVTLVDELGLRQAIG